MEFLVLGPLEIRRHGETVVLGSHRQRTLLAMLLLEPGRVVPVDALTDALWGERPPADPRNAVQTYMSRLRAAVGEDLPLSTRSPGYLLELPADRVDAIRFQHLLDAARRLEQPEDVRANLEEALGLWRGPAYAEFTDGPVRAHGLRLEEQRLRALEWLAEVRLALGEVDDLVAELGAGVAEHPLRERLVELHVAALAAADRQAEALAAYRTYRDGLAEQTGLEPSPHLQVLQDSVLRGEHRLSRPFPAAGVVSRPSSPPRTGPPTTPSVRPVTASGVPTPTTSLIGRRAAVADIPSAVTRHPVVTLTGTGGVGKTRLAIAVATAIRDRTVRNQTPRDQGPQWSPDEIAWVELAPVTDPSAIEHVIAAATGVQLTGGQTTRTALLDALATRRMLLVLDNLEHLLATAAPLVGELARRCPSVRTLATSRERLAVDGERVIPVAAFDTSEVDDTTGGEVTDAVQLFIERAADVASGHDLTSQRTVVAEICRALDGLPLAIELAAARLAATTPRDLLGMLREDPAAAGARRGGPMRQRDLWTVVEWSHRLLDSAERELFDGLGVFAGTFSVDDVRAVCVPDWSRARTLTALIALTERSLVSGPTPEEGRYRLLRPLRAFARQRLADREVLTGLAERHAEVLTTRAEQMAGSPLTEHGRLWLEHTLDDLREIARRARLSGDVERLARLVAATYRFDYWRPGGELLSWAETALELAGLDAHPLAPQIHGAAAAAAWRNGDLARARRLAERGIHLGGDRDDAVSIVAYEALGDVATFSGHLEDAEAAFREELRLAQRHGDTDGIVLGLTGTALVAAYAGRVTEAVELADLAERAAESAGVAAQAFARYTRGECRAETDPHTAIELLEEAVGLARDGDAWFVEGVARVTTASLRARHGAPQEALQAFAETLHHWQRSGNRTQQWTTLRNLAELLVRIGADEPAVTIAVAAGLERRRTVFGMESHRLDQAMATARRRLGGQRFTTAWHRGSRLDAEQVLELARTTIDQATGLRPPVGDPPLEA